MHSSCISLLFFWPSLCPSLCPSLTALVSQPFPCHIQLLETFPQEMLLNLLLFSFATVVLTPFHILSPFHASHTFSRLPLPPRWIHCRMEKARPPDFRQFPPHFYDDLMRRRRSDVRPSNPFLSNPKSIHLLFPIVRECAGFFLCYFHITSWQREKVTGVKKKRKLVPIFPKGYPVASILGVIL